MNIWRSVAGVVDVELTSAELEQSLTAINGAGIEITQLNQISELTCCFRIYRKDFSKLRRLSEKRGETVRLIRRSGVYWVMRSMLRRPVLLTGMLCLICLVLCLPTRVFFVRVEGNVTIPSKQILAAAEKCGIQFGASRRNVRSEKVKNALLSAIPQLQWAGVNTSGCVAMISVRERTDAESENAEKEVSNIVAVRDGYILSGTVTRGNAAFQVGQTVKAGQILISGYTDCGICIRATQSEGEVIAQTNREIDAVTPSKYMQRGEKQCMKRKISLLIRKKRINLWKDSGISDASCGRMYKEYYITLPGGFQLPIALCVETFTIYKTHSAELSQADAENGFTGFADRYLNRFMIAGEIKDRTETVSRENGIFRLTGKYTCVEMIGREQREQIGDTNGKSS